MIAVMPINPLAIKSGRPSHSLPRRKPTLKLAAMIGPEIKMPVPCMILIRENNTPVPTVVAEEVIKLRIVASAPLLRPYMTRPLTSTGNEFARPTMA